MFIMIDGMDGTGKTTMTQHLKSVLISEGNKIFDLRDYWKEKGAHPEYSEISNCDFIFGAEPTFAGIGKVVREELIKNGKNYPPEAVAEAYSLDRLILYKNIIIPAIQDGKTVILDRGVSTSLCYQTLTGLPLEWVEKLPGNDLALKNRPDHLIIFKLSPEEAVRRLQGRTEKNDNAVFEKFEFQKKSMEFYESSEYKRVFEKHGTKIHYLLVDESLDIIKEKSLNYFKNLLTSNLKEYAFSK